MLSIPHVATALLKTVSVNGEDIKFADLFALAKYSNNANPAIHLQLDALEEHIGSPPGVITRIGILYAFQEAITVAAGSRTNSDGRLLANPTALRTMVIDANNKVVPAPANYQTPKGTAQLLVASQAVIWLNGLGSDRATWESLSKLLPMVEEKNSDGSTKPPPVDPITLNSEAWTAWCSARLEKMEDAEEIASIESLIDAGEAASPMAKTRARKEVVAKLNSVGHKAVVQHQTVTKPAEPEQGQLMGDDDIPF